MLTKEQAMEILQTIWPKAPMVEVIKAAILCRDYGLNPLMRHIALVPFWNKKTSQYDWTVIQEINATRTLARRVKPFGYHDGPRRMTDEEQNHIFGKVDLDNLWAITITVDAQGLKSPGYGCWPLKETPYGADKGNTALNMAMIRSERASLLRQCPAEMAGDLAGVEVMEGRFIPTSEQDIKAVVEQPKQIDYVPDSDADRDRQQIELSVRNMNWAAPKLAAYLQDRCKDKAVKGIGDIPSDKLHAIANELADWELMSS